MKSGENCSGGFREDIQFEKLNNFIHVYSPEARADSPKGTKFCLQLTSFTTLIVHLMLQP